jgi:peptidyl-prolyl cis-trans isomerase SurA
MKFIKPVVLLGLITQLGCFALFGQYKAGDEIEKILVLVDNEIILKSELDITVAQFQQSYKLDESNIDCEVLETLILNKMLVAKSKIDSVYVEEDQLNNELDRRIQQMFAQYGGDAEKVLKEYGKTLDELKAEIRPTLKEQMLIQKMQDKINGGVSVTPQEVRQFYKKIDRDSLPKFSTQVEIGQVVRYPKPSAAAKEEVREKLERIKKQIQEGADFATLAKEYSQDPGSAKLGGELGFFNRGQLVPQYEAAALKMRPGELSEVVESMFGFHLIQLIERRGNEFNSRHILIKPEVGYNDINREKQLLDSVANLIRKDSIDFTVAVGKYNEDEQLKSTNGFMTDYEGNYRISVEKLGTMYFKIEDMEVGDINNAEAYLDEEGKDAARIIYLKSRTKPHVANLKDDYQQLKEAALAEKKNAKIEDWFAETKDLLFIKVDDQYKSCKILE